METIQIYFMKDPCLFRVVKIMDYPRKYLTKSLGLHLLENIKV